MKTVTENPPAFQRLPASANPFSQDPRLDKLRDDLVVNVAKNERIVSAFVGIALMASGRYLRRRGGFLGKILGAMLMSRAVTGHCPLYYFLGRDTLHYAKSKH